MKVIGITGGIGSGKSLVTQLMQEKYGALVINTDRIAKEQMEPGGASFDKVVSYFGNGILSEDGSIDRGRLSEIVFSDKEKRLQINRITHPIVLEEVDREIRAAREQGNIPYVVIETALMIESGYASTCDEVWYVYAPEQERRSRLKESRGYSDEKIDTIFYNQRKDHEFRSEFTKVIENTADIAMLEAQVHQLLSSGNPA